MKKYWFELLMGILLVCDMMFFTWNMETVEHVLSGLFGGILISSFIMRFFGKK